MDHLVLLFPRTLMSRHAKSLKLLIDGSGRRETVVTFLLVVHRTTSSQIPSSRHNRLGIDSRPAPAPHLTLHPISYLVVLALPTPLLLQSQRVLHLIFVLQQSICYDRCDRDSKTESRQRWQILSFLGVSYS
jgi:hypothetical protein